MAAGTTLHGRDRAGERRTRATPMRLRTTFVVGGGREKARRHKELSSRLAPWPAAREARFGVVGARAGGQGK